MMRDSVWWGPILNCLWLKYLIYLSFRTADIQVNTLLTLLERGLRPMKDPKTSASLALWQLS